MNRKPTSTRSTSAAPRRTTTRSNGKTNGSQPHATAELTHERIAERAHELYVRSGFQQGRADEFWFEAERQLREEGHALSV